MKTLIIPLLAGLIVVVPTVAQPPETTEPNGRFHLDPAEFSSEFIDMETESFETIKTSDGQILPRVTIQNVSVAKDAIVVSLEDPFFGENRRQAFDAITRRNLTFKTSVGGRVSVALCQYNDAGQLIVIDSVEKIHKQNAGIITCKFKAPLAICESISNGGKEEFVLVVSHRHAGRFEHDTLIAQVRSFKKTVAAFTALAKGSGEQRTYLVFTGNSKAEAETKAKRFVRNRVDVTIHRHRRANEAFDAAMLNGLMDQLFSVALSNRAPSSEKQAFFSLVFGTTITPRASIAQINSITNSDNTLRRTAELNERKSATSANGSVGIPGVVGISAGVQTQKAKKEALSREEQRAIAKAINGELPSVFLDVDQLATIADEIADEFSIRLGDFEAGTWIDNQRLALKASEGKRFQPLSKASVYLTNDKEFALARPTKNGLVLTNPTGGSATVSLDPEGRFESPLGWPSGKCTNGNTIEFDDKSVWKCGSGASTTFYMYGAPWMRVRCYATADGLLLSRGEKSEIVKPDEIRVRANEIRLPNARVLCLKPSTVKQVHYDTHRLDSDLTSRYQPFLDVKRGDLISIRARPDRAKIFWANKELRPITIGPDGIDIREAHIWQFASRWHNTFKSNPLAHDADKLYANFGALVGRFGTNEVFVIGKGGEFVATCDGILFLNTAENSMDRQRNRGTFKLDYVHYAK